MLIGQDGVSGLAIPPSLVETRGMALPPWKKVLVVDLGFLGDTIHSIPALRALAQAGARVDVVTTTVGSEILALLPEIYQIWKIHLQKPSPPFWKSFSQLRSLRGEKYDAAMTWVGSERNLFYVGWSGARDRIARITGKSSWLAGLGLTQRVDGTDRAAPVFEQRLEFLRKLGWSGKDSGWNFKIHSLERFKNKLPAKKPYLHLSVNAASSPLNEWPLDDWAEVLQQIWKKEPKLEVLATGAGSERERARLTDLASLVRDDRLKIILERIPIDFLASALQEAELHLGLDSGVLHLAVALGKPTVAIFRDSVGRPGWAPRGSKHRVLLRDCACNQTGNISCEGGRALCLSKITPAEVAESTLALLSHSHQS